MLLLIDVLGLLDSAGVSSDLHSKDWDWMRSCASAVPCSRVLKSKRVSRSQFLSKVKWDKNLQICMKHADPLIQKWSTLKVSIITWESKHAHEARKGYWVIDDVLGIVYFHIRVIAQLLQKSCYNCMRLSEFYLKCLESILIQCTTVCILRNSCSCFSTGTVLRYVNFTSAVSGAESMALLKCPYHSCHCDKSPYLRKASIQAMDHYGSAMRLTC